MRKSRVWVILLAASLLSSCVTYQVVKQEVLPPLKQVVIGAGPHLVEALIQDLFALVGAPFEFGEKLLAPEPVAPPAP